MPSSRFSRAHSLSPLIFTSIPFYVCLKDFFVPNKIFIEYPFFPIFITVCRQEQRDEDDDVICYDLSAGDDDTHIHTHSCSGTKKHENLLWENTGQLLSFFFRYVFFVLNWFFYDTDEQVTQNYTENSLGNPILMKIWLDHELNRNLWMRPDLTEF